jgi:hypothetical protein
VSDLNRSEKKEMSSAYSPKKRFIVAVIASVAATIAACSWVAGVYWSESREVPVPALGQVVERSNHGHKYYLTAFESTLDSEYAIACAVMLLFVSYALSQRWGALEKKANSFRFEVRQK